MAQNLTITQLVNVILKQGKVDSAAITKEFPKLISQALGRLPGTTAIIDQKIELNPKFDGAKVAAGLRKVMDRPDVKAMSTSDAKGYHQLGKAIDKTASSLEHLNKLSTEFKFDKRFLGKLDQLAAGTLPAKAINQPAFQARIKSFQAYSKELGTVVKRIHRQEQDIYSKVSSTNAQGIATELTAGAHISKGLTEFLSGMKTRTDAVNSNVRGNDRATASLNTLASAVARTDAAIGRSKTRPQFDKFFGGKDKEGVIEAKKAIAREQALRAKLANEGVTEAVNTKRSAYLATGSDASVSRLNQVKAQELAYSNEPTRISREKAKTDSLIEAKARVDRLAPQASDRAATKELLSVMTRGQLEEMKAVTLNERSKLRAHAGTPQFETERFNDLVHLQKSLGQATRDLNTLDRGAAQAVARATNPKRMAQVAAVARGQSAYTLANGDVRAIPTNAHRDTRAFLTSEISRSEAHTNRLTQDIGPDHQRTKAASEATHALRTQLQALNREATHLHPIMHKLGGVLGQFAKYALGYGALYKVTQALSSMASEVVNLEDKLQAIQAITGTTTAGMEQMSASIKQVAVTSAFSISDIADAVKVVAQAGTELKDIPKTIQAVSDLASASGASLQSAADIITTAKTVWENVSVSEIADRVTQAANVSKLAVEDLQTIFSLGASFAKNANVSLDQYLSVVATLRNSGVRASTISTGTSQFLTEVMAPDAQFGSFLSKRYKAVGEDVSATDARKKFAAYKYEENPVLAVLNELKRIGADSAAALPELQRSIDKRGFNVLQPLLAHLDKLQETSGRLSTAPTAQETAKIAMDSLKKATGNLEDQFNVLADTLAKDTLPALTKLVTGLSTGVKKLDDFINTANLNRGGQTLGLAPTLAGAGSGALAGASMGRGLWKIATSAAGAVVGGSGVSIAGDISAVNGHSEGVTAAVQTGLTAYLLSKSKFITGFFKKSAVITEPAVAGASRSFLGKLTAATTGFLAKWSTQLSGTMLALAPPQAKLFAGAIAGIGLALWSFYDTVVAVKELFKSEEEKLADFEKLKEKGLDPVLTRAYQARRKAEASQSEFNQFAQATDGMPAPASSLTGQVNKQRSGLKTLRQDIGQAVGQAAIDPKVTDELLAQKLQELSDYRREDPAKDSSRKAKLADLQTLLGGSGEIDQQGVQAAIDASSGIRGAINELVAQTAKRYIELIEKETELAHDGSELPVNDKAELETLRGQAEISPTFRAILRGNTTGIPKQDLLQSLSDRAANGANFVGTPPNMRALAKADVLSNYRDISKQTDADKKEISTNSFRASLRDGMAQFGPAFGQELAGELSKGGALGNLNDKQLIAGINELIPRLIQVESTGNPNAVSPKGAKGIVQLMPETSRDPGFGVKPLPKGATPEQQVQFGKDYLFGVAKFNPHFSQEELISAYHRGPEAVNQTLKAKEPIADPVYVNAIKGTMLNPKLSAEESETRAILLDTVAKELLLSVEKYAGSLRTLQDAASQQVKSLTDAPMGDKPVSFTSQTGKAVKTSPLEMAKVLDAEALRVSEGLTAGGGGLQDQITALLTERDLAKKEALFAKLRPEFENVGGVTGLIDKGALQINRETSALELDPNNRVKRLAEKQQQLSVEDPVKTDFPRDQATEKKISLLQERITELETTNKSQLKAEDLYGQLNTLQQGRVSAKRIHAEGNFYTDDEIAKGAKETELGDIAEESRGFSRQLSASNVKLNFELDKARLVAKQKTLDADIAVLKSSRDSLSSVGKLAEFNEANLLSLQAQQKTVNADLLNLQRTQSEVTPEEIRAANTAFDLERIQGANQSELSNYRVQQQNVSSGMSYFGAQGLADNAYQQNIGQELGVDSKSAFAGAQIGELTALQTTIGTRLTDSLKQLATHVDENGQAFAKNSVQEAALTQHTQDLREAFGQTSLALADAQARLDNLNPTVAGEMAQISRKSIGAKISNLPSSLKDLSSNIENRIVGATDGWTTALADSAVEAAESLLKLKKIPDILLQAWTNQQTAKGSQAQLVAQGSIGLASQISSIQNNETDPVRQEMLIKRAQDAQAEAEAIGQNQVDAADAEYARVQYENSFAGKSSGIAKEMISGIATDYIKGTLQDGIAGLFGGGKRGETAHMPTFTEVTNFPGGFGGGTEEPSGRVGGLLSNLFSSDADGATSQSQGSTGGWFSNMFSDDIPTTEGGSDATDVGDKVASSVASSLESPWYTGFTDTMTTGFTGFVGGLTESFGSFTGALGVLLGLQNMSAKEDTVSKIQRYVGLAQSVVGLASAGMGAANAMSSMGGAAGTAPDMSAKGFNQVSMGGSGPTSDFFLRRATGGEVVGPGTGTSDSIPAMLSNGEYVLNAKTVAAIGKDTLNAWNFQAEKPARFATGGFVGGIQSSVNKAASSMPVAAAAPSATPAQAQSVRVVLVDDQRNVKNYLTSSDGEKVLVDFVRRNSLSLKTVLR